MREEGAVLVVVLVALALLAALAGLVIRVADSDLASLAAERAVLQREGMLDSALALLGARLPAADLAEDGSPLSLPVPGGRVALRIRAASGLLNPNATRAPVLASGLAALGASPEQAARLTRAMVAARKAGNRMAFRSLGEVAALFNRDAGLWARVAPYLTLSGRAETLDASHAPLALRAVVAPASAAEVDFSGAGGGAAKGFYEIWLHVEAPGLDASDPEGRLWTRVSALAGRDHRLHILALFWPQTLEGG